MTAMEEQKIINDTDIRQSLICRAEAYAKSSRTSFSAIGLAAVSDSKFLSRVQNGLSFNIRTYQRVMDWLDAAEKNSVGEVE